jgi:hypothetical protein
MQVCCAAGDPCLLFNVIARIPPLYHVAAAQRLAKIILFPGWQVVNWLTGGVMAAPSITSC